MSEPATGTIHDLGYKRYGGARSSAGTRWRVILANQVATGWKTWWRFKASLGLAVLLILAYALSMVFSLKTHRELFASIAHEEETDDVGDEPRGQQERAADQDEPGVSQLPARQPPCLKRPAQ